MVNLSFDELRLIAQLSNISDYENRSKVDLIKALSEPKPEIPKLEKLKQQTPKSRKLKPKPEPEKKIRVKIYKKKLKKHRKDFDELRHEFDKKRNAQIQKSFLCC